MSSAENKDFPLGVSGFQFSDLYQPKRLKDLHSLFWTEAEGAAPGILSRFQKVGTQEVKPPEEADILIEVGHQFGNFIAKLFNITTHAAKIKATTDELAPIFKMKKEFLNIRVYKRLEEPAVAAAQFDPLHHQVHQITSHEVPSSAGDKEAQFAKVVTFLVDCEKTLQKEELEAGTLRHAQNLLTHIHGSSIKEKIVLALKTIEDWCVQAYVDPKRREQHMPGWVSFIRPQKLDFENLVPIERRNASFSEKIDGHEHHYRFRDGFKLTDPRMNNKEVMREIDYCILCHQREKDSCSKGFEEKTGGYKKNPLGIPLNGCPLDERISEMHQLRKEGNAIGSLAMIMLDNPMCPGTGHRICNDCMKGCIFQKQDPVNIPQNETGVLTDVLNMPYGFEIYSLLTRFNPLNKARPYALPYNGVDVLVVGLGPAGYTLAHYLANEGFGVVGIDGLKLEPVDPMWTGKGKPFPKPILSYNEMKKDLDERILMGFGGVSEYGITVRWDKNFLAVIYMSLLRRKNTKFYGGVRFGGTLNLDDAWELGFKHVAIATGAGKPTVIDMKNNLCRGIRKASDFLMALQLTGAFKKNVFANLQIQLPALVIGGGLTAIDTATEILAYYPIQVEKALDRFEVLSREFGEDTVWGMCDAEEKGILKTFLAQGAIVREERKKAEKEHRAPNFIKMIREWGGVSIAYRKRMVDCPAYRLNHEEVMKALEEGISFIENVSPVEAHKDEFGALKAVTFKRNDGTQIELKAKGMCVAAGTSPNTIYEREYPGVFQLDDKKQFFKRHKAVQLPDGSWQPTPADRGEPGFFLSYSKEGKLVSYYGDNHPDYAGNVVKAMASSKHGAKEVFKLFTKEIANAEKTPTDLKKYEQMTEFLDQALVPRVVRVERLTPTIVEVVVKGRYAARKFEPGQFYRLQNYESTAHSIDGLKLTMEGIALTGAWVEKEKDLLSMIVLEMGVSSKLCATLKPGEPVVVMGPTGTPSEIPKNQNVLLVGGGLGNAVLLSISRAMRANGCKVLYFAGYKNPEDIFRQKEIQEGTDQVIWACDRAPGIKTQRPQDISFVGNILQAMESYASGKLQNPPMIPFQSIDHIIVIGSDRMMAAVGGARHTVLKPYLKTDHLAIASINSPMQCMMKEVCAQCLQRHVDPKTGKEEFIFSCFNQDQAIDCVDFKNLNERLKTNSLQEKLTGKHLEYLMKKGKLERI